MEVVNRGGLREGTVLPARMPGAVGDCWASGPRPRHLKHHDRNLSAERRGGAPSRNEGGFAQSIQENFMYDGLLRTSERFNMIIPSHLGSTELFSLRCAVSQSLRMRKIRSLSLNRITSRPRCPARLFSSMKSRSQPAAWRNSSSYLGGGRKKSVLRFYIATIQTTTAVTQLCGDLRGGTTIMKNIPSNHQHLIISYRSRRRIEFEHFKTNSIRRGPAQPTQPTNCKSRAGPSANLLQVPDVSNS